MRLAVRALLVCAALFVGGATQLACKINDYCLNCAKGGDGGVKDAGSDAAGSDAAGSNDGSTCVPSGPEICDGIDNDCDGIIDNGTLPGVGDACDNVTGACAGGTKQCVPLMAGDPTTDALVCNKVPTAEACDGIDNDCDGTVDEGDPESGARCGPGAGTCVQGVMHCVSGSLQCMGAVGPTPEVCDGQDNDCNGVIDDGIASLGSCGAAEPGCATPPCGECKLGMLSCVGGTTVCSGNVDPGIESCNGKDDDCDGKVDEDFNLMTDPMNCGSCGNVCGAGLTNEGNASWKCVAGACEVANCDAGYHNNNMSDTDGCEFGPCFISGPEVCDGYDNDCDGTIDNATKIGGPPAICQTKGECAGTVATCACKNTPDAAGCSNHNGWQCNYGGTVSTDGMGNIIPETLCDGKDNDCNGVVDDNQPNKGKACDDGKKGACRSTGTFQCDPANLNGPTYCKITSPGAVSTPEKCNNIDDDCDGFVDNDVGQTASYKNAGDLPGGGQDWINIGNGVQMMKYEASKPDAADTAGGDPGAVTGTVCSQTTRMPWVNVTYPQAAAACASIGARLCTEEEWHRACAVINPTSYPITISSTSTKQLIEAEDYSSIAPGSSRAWVEDYQPGFSGIAEMAAIPNTGANNNSATTAVSSSPRLDYKLTFAAGAAGNWRVCVRGFAPTSNDNTVYVGINPSLPGSSGNLVSVSTSTYGSWVWMKSSTIAVNAGTNFLSVYMEEDGLRVDQVYLTTSNSCPTTTINSAGNTWAYATNATTYQPDTCNGHDYNADLSQPDATLLTGSLGSCYANDQALTGGTSNDHAFDMSGNVKEWAAAHQSGENPIRGGASNNTGVGIDCALNFTLADDTFFFTNVGFRCCR